MAPKKGGEGSKKAAGQARKADAAAAKAAAEDAKKATVEDAHWKKGEKDSSKKEAEAAKKAEAARKKAEKDALLAEDERNTPGRAAPKNSKTAEKKTRRGGLDAALGSLDLGDNKKLPELEGRNVDDAFDVLADVDGPEQPKVDRHAERRHNVFEAYKAKRMQEMRDEGLKLTLSQRKERIDREWRKHPDNPRSDNYAGTRIAYNATKEEILEITKAERAKTEARLAVK